MTLAEKKRRLRELGMPAMTPQEEQAFQQDLIDTAGRDLREAGRGTVKTTMKGTKVLDGAYKGLTRPQMEQSIITGAAPPGKFMAGAMGSVRGSLTGDSLYAPRVPQIAQAAPAASAAPAPAQTATATPQPPAAMPAKTVTQALTTVPSLARPPLAAAKNATAAPRPQGLIDGKPSGQWLQEAANRQGIANSYGTIQPQAAPQIAPPAATRPVDPALMEPRGFGSGAAPTPRPIAPALTEPRGFGAGPVAKPTAAVTPSAPAATPNGPPLSLSAPKMLSTRPVNGSPIADTMRNNQMIRPGFDKIIAAQKFPVPTAAMPKPASSSPTSRAAKTLQPPQLVMAR